MTKHIQLGSVKVPLENYATQANAILGIKGSGKTTTAKGIAEQLLDAHIPILVLDPVGMWRYLKVPKEKGGKAYKVVVAGGQAPDLPLTPHTAPEIVRSAIRSNIPLVIDLYDVRLSKADWRRIVKATAEILMFENKGIRHVFLEEAAEYVPQMVRDGDVYSAVEKLTRMGGNASVGITLINPRAQEVNKAVLELCELLILQRQKGSHAMAALEKWVTMAQDVKGVAKTIASLATGEALVWPESAEPVRTHLPASVTFHPDRKKPELPRGSVPEDVTKFVTALRDALPALEAELKQNDPSELRKQIAALQRELAAAKVATMPAPAPATETIEVPVLGKGDVEDFKLVAGGVQIALDNVSRSLKDSLNSFLQKISLFPNSAGAAPRVAARKPASVITRPASTAVPGPGGPRAHGKARAGSEEIGTGGLRRMMVALAQRPHGLTRKQLGVRAGLSSSSGTFGTYLGRMRALGWCADDGSVIKLSEEGAQALGKYEPLPTGEALLRYWLHELGQTGAARMLETLYEYGPMSAEQLGDRIGMSSSSGTFGTYLGRLRSLELIKGQRHALEVSEELLE